MEQRHKSQKLLTGASNCNPIKADMDLSAGVPETKSAPRHGWNGIALIVHPLKVWDFGVKECCPSCVTHSGGPKCDALECRICGEMELHKQGVEFREGSTERMADLYTAGGMKCKSVQRSSNWMIGICSEDGPG